MSKAIVGRRQVTIEEVAMKRLDSGLNQAIRTITIIEDFEYPPGMSISMSQGFLKIGVWLQIPVMTTVQKLAAILAGLLTLGTIVQWLVGLVRPGH